MNNITGISISGGGGLAAGTSSWISPKSVSTSEKRIQREMTELNNDPPPDCSAGPKGDNLYNWVSTIIGPPGTAYQGGIFFLNLTFQLAVHSNLQRQSTRLRPLPICIW